MKTLLRAFSVIALAGLLSTTAAAPAGAQCGPDLLDTGTCCLPPPLSLPNFPFLQQTIRYVCFDSCNIQVTGNVCCNFGPPIPAMSGGFPVCGVYLIRFSIRTCGSNMLLWQGTLRAQYSRNWLETNSSSIQKGVWRFLLNGDMVPQPALPANPCVRPACAGSFANRVYFTGYLDYAVDCAGNWEAAWCLQHDCDMWTHSTLSARPLGSSHPNRSFVFVGPTAGFVVNPASGPMVSLAITNEAVRANDWTAIPNICRFEEPVAPGGLIQPVFGYCACPNTGTNQQFFQTVVQGNGICLSRFDTMAPPIGPFPFSLKRIGAWTNPLTFPGPETLLLAAGTMITADGCTTTTQTDYMEGVETITGNTAVTYGSVPLGSVFLDLASSDRPNNTTRIGAPHVWWFLLNLN